MIMKCNKERGFVKLTELRTFVTLVETRHFTKTAEQLFLSQPTISVHVKRLEEDVGHSLLIRDSFAIGVEVSEMGWIVYRHAKEILFQLEQMQSQLDESEGVFRGTLRIGATHTIHEILLDDMIHLFSRAHPEVSLDIQLMNHDQVAAALKHREIDLGMIEGELTLDGMRQIVFARDQLHIIGAMHLALEDATWIVREEGSASRYALHRWLHASSIVPARTITVDANYLARQLILNGSGIGALSERLVTSFPSESFTLHAKGISNRTFRYVLPEKMPTRLAERWIDFLETNWKG